MQLISKSTEYTGNIGPRFVIVSHQMLINNYIPFVAASISELMSPELVLVGTKTGPHGHNLYVSTCGSHGDVSKRDRNGEFRFAFGNSGRH